VVVDVAAGSGGRGALSFRREKYVPHGGPDGGDGGHGGDVVVVADSSDASLGAYRERRRFAAPNGSPGGGGRRSGRDGEDALLHVPPGTVVRDGDEVLADLDRRGAVVIVARGGRGGRGNARFASSTRQAPRISEIGEPGERRRVTLELKLIADVGLVGLPNAGKSTLLAALTGARPRIASYPFTTLHPNLGVAEVGSQRPLIIADVPGLIEGASRGAGLGLDFLRHLERTRALIHVVDASQGVDAAERALTTVQDELRSFSAGLASRPTLLAFNKIDVPDGSAAVAALLDRHPGSIAISAAERAGLDALLEAVSGLVPDAREEAAPLVPSVAHRTYRHRARGAAIAIVRDDGIVRVEEPDVVKLVAMTDLDSEEAVQRLQRQMRERGDDRALAAAGCADGDTVVIGDYEFTYVDED